jgi:hypothetical protein
MGCGDESDKHCARKQVVLVVSSRTDGAFLLSISDDSNLGALDGRHVDVSMRIGRLPIRVRVVDDSGIATRLPNRIYDARRRAMHAG